MYVDIYSTILKNQQDKLSHDFSYSDCRMTETKTLKEKIKEFEQEEIINALKECDWVMARAARKLGITERIAGYKIKKYEIKKDAAADFGLRNK